MRFFIMVSVNKGELTGLAVLLLPVVIVWDFLCNAYALSLTWNLFLVPLGLPVISGAHVLGIALFLKSACSYSNSNSSKSDDDPIYTLILLFVRPLVLAFFVHIVAHGLANFI